MTVIEPRELERLVRETLLQKAGFSADAELGLGTHARPAVGFVHGGNDPFLDRQFEAWLCGTGGFVATHQLLNRLCRAGALAPGEYAVTQRPA